MFRNRTWLGSCGVTGGLVVKDLGSDSLHRILQKGCKAVSPGGLVNTTSIQLLLPVASLATLVTSHR